MRDGATRSNGDWIPIYIGLFLWLLSVVATWPSAATFIDEAGYLGQARLVLDGTLRPVESTPCISLPTEQGLLAKYPFALALGITPLFAIHPRLALLTGLAGATLLTVGMARVFETRQTKPVWCLLVLAHPTAQLLSRTVMTDLLLAVALFLTWRAIQADGRRSTLILSGLLIACKPTGVPLIAALLAGETLARAMSSRPLRPLLWALAGATAGLTGVLGLNLLATGTPWYAYHWAHDHLQQFSIGHFLTSGPTHLRTLLLLPPGLILGLVPLWRRRDFGLIFAAIAHFSLMSGYYYVDTGANFAESLLVGARLMLPAIVALLPGYGELIGTLLDRVKMTRIATWALPLAVGAMSLGVGLAQERLHRPLNQARIAAESLADEHDGRIGTPFDGLKALAFSSREVLYWSGDRSVCVALCNTASFSRKIDSRTSCEFEGFSVREEVGTFRVLVQDACP